MHSFADPACTEINATLRELWESWAKAPGKRFHGAMIVGEYYNVSSFSAMAIPLMKVMANDIPYYHSTGTRHMHYVHVVTADCGTLSLTNSLFAALLDRSLLECEDDVVALRLTADARRFRYTHNMVRFLHHFARMRLFENRGRSECAELEARALRDYGEALSREKLMVQHQWQDDEYHFYDSGLTATWLHQAYAEVMADYGLEVLETNGKPVEKDKRLG